MKLFFDVDDNQMHVTRCATARLYALSTFSWTGIAGPGEVPAPTQTKKWGKSANTIK